MDISHSSKLYPRSPDPSTPWEPVRPVALPSLRVLASVEGQRRSGWRNLVIATLAFDTHKAVKALREAGFDDLQAEAVTEQISAAIGENLVTKDDLENAVEKLELRITTKVYAAVVVGVGLIKALDFLLG